MEQGKLTLGRSQRNNLNIAGLSSLAVVGLTTGAAAADSSLRQLPVLGEYYNVAGNVLWSGPLALGAVAIAAGLEGRNASRTLGKAGRILSAAVLGSALGIGANLMSETETGYNHIEGPVLAALDQYVLKPMDLKVGNKYATTSGKDLAAGTITTVMYAAGLGAYRHNMLTGNIREQATDNPNSDSATKHTNSPTTMPDWSHLPPDRQTLLEIGWQAQQQRQQQNPGQENQ